MDGMDWKIGRTKNGLRYFLLRQKNFGKSMAALVVKRGANHILWRDANGNVLTFPQGTAHFIEHKLFQQEWGDAFTKFAQNGASANAFTDAEKTVYYFSCREKFRENLELLLNFVQKPYFTEEDTQKEKAIIASEIAMYQDDPNWLVYYKLLEGMYAVHPVREQIAGTEESIQKITADTLQTAYDVYYTTEEMALICVGNFSVRESVKLAESFQPRETEWKPILHREPADIVEKYREKRKNLSCPLFQIGFKLPPVEKVERLRYRIAMGFVLEILAGEGSPFFRKGYEAELLDEPLGAAFFCGDGYAFAAFSGTGEYPEETAELLAEECRNLKKNGISEKAFLHIRKKMLGRFLRRLNTAEELCMGQIEWGMADASAAEVLHLIKSIRREEAEKLLQNVLSIDTMVLSVVR